VNRPRSPGRWAAVMVATTGLLLSTAMLVDGGVGNAAAAKPVLKISRLAHSCGAPRHLSFRLRLSKLVKGKEYEVVIENSAGRSVANTTIVARSSTYHRKKVKLIAAPGRLATHKQKLHFVLDQRLTPQLSKQVAGPHAWSLPRCQR
jgi:hypothetical protein